MPRYLISFNDGWMDFPEEEFPAVAKAAMELVREARDAGVWVYGAGLDSQRASIVAPNGLVTDGPFPETKEVIGGFCVVDVPFPGQRIPPPYVVAYVLLDGADIGLQHLILGCPPEQVRMGMRVAAVWRPAAEWGLTLQNIDHFAPTGEPDAAYETYAHHL